jgi:hypothetical protein
MPQPIIYIAVTAHGFGHAARSASLAAAIKQLQPDALVILVTTAPRWLLESYIEGDFIHRPRALDVGVLQSDSFTMDKPATLEKLRQLKAQQNRIIAGEVNFIQQNRVGLVLADIPPLAAPIARAAGIPCWMVSNFGFDFIYRPWGGEFNEMADWIADCYGHSDRLFRLPLHEEMGAFPVITDVGFTGGSPRYSANYLRQYFNLMAPKEQIVLMTFGGLGLSQIPYSNLNHFPDWEFITFDESAPDLPNLVKIDNQFRLEDKRLRPVDLMPICGQLLSKPGYSTFSEACRTQTPLVAVDRHDFAEAPVLLESVQYYIPHRILSPGEFFTGDWSFLRQSLFPPRQPQPQILPDGNETIAQEVITFCQKA